MLVTQHCGGLCPLQRPRNLLHARLPGPLQRQTLPSTLQRRLAVSIPSRPSRRSLSAAAQADDDAQQQLAPGHQQQPRLPPIVSSGLKLLGSVALLCVAACAGFSRPAYAKPR
jgi:hypothetical protein